MSTRLEAHDTVQWGTPLHDEERRAPGYIRGAFLAVWLVFLLLGIWGALLRYTQGHLPAGYGSYVPWGLWIALYFHGVGMAGGAFVMGSLGYLFNIRGFSRGHHLRTTIIISVAAIMPAFLGIWFDLGRMGRAQNIFLTPSFTSMMAFNAWMYNGYMLVAAACWALSFRERSLWLRPLLCLALLFSIMFPSQSGAFFGVVDAKPYWHSALLPVLFFASAITAGTAALLFVRWLTHLLRPERNGEWPAALRKLRMVLLGTLILYFVLEFAEFSIVLWNPGSHSPAVELVLFGPYWWVFWGVHLALGGVLPLVLLAMRRPGAWVWASLLVMVTFVSTRLNVLIPGQAVSELRGLQEAFQHSRLTYIYHATPMEYLIGFLMAALAITILYAGERISETISRRIAREERHL
jgi:protein NrfD